MLQISMQTERGRKRTRVSVMKLIYCSVILGFFLTLQHHILQYAERFLMFWRGSTFLDSIDFYTQVSMAVGTLSFKNQI